MDASMREDRHRTETARFRDSRSQIVRMDTIGCDGEGRVCREYLGSRTGEQEGGESAPFSNPVRAVCGHCAVDTALFFYTEIPLLRVLLCVKPTIEASFVRCDDHYKSEVRRPHTFSHDMPKKKGAAKGPVKAAVAAGPTPEELAAAAAKVAALPESQKAAAEAIAGLAAEDAEARGAAAATLALPVRWRRPARPRPRRAARRAAALVQAL